MDWAIVSYPITSMWHHRIGVPCLDEVWLRIEVEELNYPELGHFPFVNFIHSRSLLCRPSKVMVLHAHPTLLYSLLNCTYVSTIKHFCLVREAALIRLNDEEMAAGKRMVAVGGDGSSRKQRETVLNNIHYVGSMETMTAKNQFFRSPEGSSMEWR